MDLRTEKMKEEWNRKPYQTDVKAYKDAEIKRKVREWGGVFSTERYVEDFTITPEIASYFLDTMKKNRHLRPSTVQKYENDMKEGKFVDSPSLVCFDTEGSLVDGQHRMKAIIKADTPVVLSLKFGFKPGTVFDKNAVRTTADTFRISELTDPSMADKNIISIINVVVEAKLGSTYLKGMSDSRKADFANEYGEELLETNYIANKGVTHGICNKAGVKAGMFIALIYGIDSKHLYHFATCANNLTAENNAETAATVFGRQVFETNYRDSSKHLRLQTERVTEEAIAWFLSGKKRNKRFSGSNPPYLDYIDLDF